MDKTIEVINVSNITKTYKKRGGIVEAVKKVSFNVNEGEIYGLIGPDGAGKTSIIQMLAGVLKITSGSAVIANTDVSKKPNYIKEIIGYMPQGLGVNLYDNLTVSENIDFFKNLRNIPVDVYKNNREELLTTTRLKPFLDRKAKNLSGGMRQKLALICTLIHLPNIILLDEPTTGVDPISRRDFWQIIHKLVQDKKLTVLLTTSYLDEAERCHRISLIHEGMIIAEDDPENLKKSAKGHFFTIIAENQKDAYEVIKGLQNIYSVEIFGEIIKVSSALILNELQEILQDKNINLQYIREIEPTLEDVFLQKTSKVDEIIFKLEKKIEKSGILNDIIECKNVTMQFGNFTAVNNVNLNIKKGEIFGLLGPNGAGKTTLIKIMCGLLEPTKGDISVAGYNIKTDKKLIWNNIGYMSQHFSLYANLPVIENLKLYAGLYNVKEKSFDYILKPLGLGDYINSLPKSIPLGIKQRLSLACALLHNPPVIFLDEPTSGVDPIARKLFWDIIFKLSRENEVTIIISTHYMTEAEHCDRLGLMHQGKLLKADTVKALKEFSEKLSGTLLSLKLSDYRKVYDKILEQYPNAFLYGSRIQLRTKSVEEDKGNIERLLISLGLKNYEIIRQPITMEETFIDFIRNAENE